MKILVVDDDPCTLTLLTELLEAESFHVLSAPHGQAALEMVQRHTDIRCVLIDYHMPGMDGLTCVQQMRRRGHMRHTPIFLMSAEWQAQKLAARQSITFLRKPFDFDQLLELLHAAAEPLLAAAC